jgi:DNA modification methylase
MIEVNRPLRPSRLVRGDCRLVLPKLPHASFDAIITDAPYELAFMEHGWDRTGVAYDVSLWREALRVLKPGGYLACFGGTRTHHRVMCAIEDAGFELRDCLMWLHGQGMPKGKASLRPAWEPIILARRLSERVVPLNAEACRVGSEKRVNNESKSKPGKAVYKMGVKGTHGVKRREVKGRYPANVLHDGSKEVVGLFPYVGGNNWQRNKARGRGVLLGEAEGSSSRFFYCAKASKSERGEDNTHPTVKPLELMRWLVRLISPARGAILDPFAGSGTTILAAREEGRTCYGIEIGKKEAAICAKRTSVPIEVARTGSDF